MLAILAVFVQQILLSNGFKITKFPVKYYRALLTAVESLLNEPVVLVPILVALAETLPGRLIVDDTSNPKYGTLKGLVDKLFIPSTGGYCQGYKVILFLWETGSFRLPVAFALWHSESGKLTELALEGLSRLRNHTHLKPLAVLGDAVYGCQEIVKRMKDYNWPCIARFKKNQNLSGEAVTSCIPRGYGEAIGTLENGTKVKIVRRKHYFVQCTHVSWDAAKILAWYALRWKIEEAFRILKSCLHLGSCQQHSMQAQALFILLCCVAFACLELVPDLSPYAVKQAVISGKLSPESLLKPELIKW